MKDGTIIFVVAIISILLVGVHGNTYAQSKNTKNISTTVSGLKIVKNNLPEVEDFSKFAKKFFSNKKFQIERIIFPVKFISEDPRDGAKEIKYIKKNKWEFDNANNIEGKILKKTKTTIEYEVSGFAIYVIYTFIIKDGKYFLISEMDSSS